MSGIPEAPPMAPPMDGGMSYASSGLGGGPVAVASSPPPAAVGGGGGDDGKALVKVEEKGLPSLEPGLSNIQAIPIKKTLMLVNNFVINTADFINKFSVLCERKLNRISQSVQRLEIVLAILEAKLDSIPWLAEAGGGAPAGGAAAAPSAGSGAPAAPPIEGGMDNKHGGGAAGGAGAGAGEAPAAPPAAAPPAMKAQDHPVYAKYFKMLKLGILKDNLRLKMQQEGVDPNVIDLDPEGPAPADGAGAGAGGAGGETGSTGGELVKVEGGGSDSDSD